MKFQISKETKDRILWDVIIFGIAIFISQEFFSKKIDSYFKIEGFKKESQIKEKIDVYYEALTIVNKNLVSDEWHGKENPPPLKIRNTGASQPTEIEINNCFSKLCLYTDNKEILSLYLDFFDKKRSNDPPTTKLAKFTSEIRKDLGYNNSFLDPNKDEYKFIMMIRDSSSFSDAQKYLNR